MSILPPNVTLFVVPALYSAEKAILQHSFVYNEDMGKIWAVFIASAVIFAVAGVALQSLLEIAAVPAPMAGLFGATTGMILGSLLGYRHLTK